MTDEILHAVREEIKVTVNGKIDKIHDVLLEQNRRQDEFNHKFDRHIATVEPYLQAYEGARAVGAAAIFWGSVVSALGASAAILRYLFAK